MKYFVPAGCQALAADGITNISVESMEHAEAASEGAILSTFKFQKNRSKSKCKSIPIITPYCLQEKDAQLWELGQITAAAQNWART